MMSGSDASSTPKYWCGHCDKVLSKTTFINTKSYTMTQTKSVWSKERIRLYGDAHDFNLEEGT